MQKQPDIQWGIFRAGLTSSLKREVIGIALWIGTVLLFPEGDQYMYSVCMIKYLEMPLLVSTWAYFSSQYFVINLKLIV